MDKAIMMFQSTCQQFLSLAKSIDVQETAWIQLGAGESIKLMAVIPTKFKDHVFVIFKSSAEETDQWFTASLYLGKVAMKREKLDKMNFSIWTGSRYYGLRVELNPYTRRALIARLLAMGLNQQQLKSLDCGLEVES